MLHTAVHGVGILLQRYKVWPTAYALFCFIILHTKYPTLNTYSYSLMFAFLDKKWSNLAIVDKPRNILTVMSIRDLTTIKCHVARLGLNQRMASSRCSIRPQSPTLSVLPRDGQGLLLAGTWGQEDFDCCDETFWQASILHRNWRNRRNSSSENDARSIREGRLFPGMQHSEWDILNQKYFDQNTSLIRWPP